MSTPTVSVYDTLKKLGIQLPEATVPVAAYVMAAQTGNLLFVSGHIAKRNGQVWVGKLGRELTTEEGKQAARTVAIDLIATLHAHTGDLNKVKRIVKIVSLINSTPDYTEPHVATNGASELLLEVFGEKGKHARSSFSVAQLPAGACVEIELFAELSA